MNFTPASGSSYFYSPVIFKFLCRPEFIKSILPLRHTKYMDHFWVRVGVGSNFILWLTVTIFAGHRSRLPTRVASPQLRLSCAFDFCNQVTNLWNSLPNEVVTASSLNVFKKRLDKH